MTPKFEYAFRRTLAWEQGLETAETARRIHDSGGATMDGISDAADGVVDGKANYPRAGVANVPIESLTIEQVKGIYFVYWWLAFRCESVADTRLAALVFDMFVNLGPAGGGKIIQEAVNTFLPDALKIAVDGLVGSVTLAKVNELPTVALNNKICDLRTAHYREKDPTLLQLQRRSESYRLS